MNNASGRATSPIWKVVLLACLTTLAPILISFNLARQGEPADEVPEVVGKYEQGESHLVARPDKNFLFVWGV